MTYLHDGCEGEVRLTYPNGCYDDNHGLCTKCGVEGELITVDTDEVQELVFVSILTESF